MSKRLKDQGQLRSDVTKMVKIETPSLSPSWIPITWQLIMNKKCFGRAHVFDFSKPVERENTKKNHRNKEGRTTSCFLHSPAPRLAQLSAERKLTSYKRFPCWESEDEMRDQLLQGTTQRTCFGLTPASHQWSWDKQRMLGKGGSAAATQKELGFPVSSSAEDPWSYCHCETRSSIAASHSLQILSVFRHGYLCWQMPSTWVPSPALLSLPSVDLGSTWQQPKPQWLDECRMLACSQPSLPGTPLTSALLVVRLLPAALTSLASLPHVWSQRSYSCLSACWQPPQLLGGPHSLLSLVPGFAPLDSTTAGLPARGKGWSQLQAHLWLWGPWCTLAAAASLHMPRTVEAHAGNQTRGEQMQLEGLAPRGEGLERRQGGRMWSHKQLSMPLVIGMHTCGYRVSLQAGIGGKGGVCVYLVFYPCCLNPNQGQNRQNNC